MTSLEWGVLIGGVASMAAVNWWFLAPDSGGPQNASADGPVTVVVRGGYSPATIHVKSGQAVRLVFDRQETDSCSEEVVFPDFGIRKFLPANAQTTIDLPPAKTGTYEFMCGMSMRRGRVVVK